jgi:hypothetical protein
VYLETTLNGSNITKSMRTRLRMRREDLSREISDALVDFRDTGSYSVPGGKQSSRRTG